MVNRYSEVILNIFEQVSRTIERVLESDIISHINIDCMQFDFMPVRRTDDAIFNLRQLYQALLTFYLSILKNFPQVFAQICST